MSKKAKTIDVPDNAAFSLMVVETDDGYELTTKFHKDGMSIGESLLAFRTCIEGMLESGVKIGTAAGFSEQDVVDVMTGEETAQ